VTAAPIAGFGAAVTITKAKNSPPYWVGRDRWTGELLAKE